MVQQPPGCSNHAAWTLGHLTYSLQGMAGELGMPAWLDESWPRLFATGSTPSSDAALYPNRTDLLAAFDDATRRITAKLQDLPETELNRPLPDEEYRRTLPTVGHALVHILVGHFATHVGELIVWRKAMNLPRMPEKFDRT